jgi:hypothetical protein
MYQLHHLNILYCTLHTNTVPPPPPSLSDVGGGRVHMRSTQIPNKVGELYLALADLRSVYTASQFFRYPWVLLAWVLNVLWFNYMQIIYSGRGKFMPLPLKSKILETPGSLVTDDINMFPLWIRTLNLQASLIVQYELSRICNNSAICP